MLDRFLIEHCAPTLAGVKTADLFTCPFYSDGEISRLLREQNGFPHEIGLFLGYPPKDVCGFHKKQQSKLYPEALFFIVHNKAGLGKRIPYPYMSKTDSPCYSLKQIPDCIEQPGIYYTFCIIIRLYSAIKVQIRLEKATGSSIGIPSIKSA